MFLAVQALSKLNSEDSVKLDRNFKKSAVIVYILQTTQSLVILRCCFVEEEKKFVKIYNAHAQLLFFSLNLLFSDVPVPVAVVVFLNSLMSCGNTPTWIHVYVKHQSLFNNWWEAEDFGDHKVFSGIEGDQSSRNIL